MLSYVIQRPETRRRFYWWFAHLGARLWLQRRLLLLCAVVGGFVGWAVFAMAPKTYAGRAMLFSPDDPPNFGWSPTTTAPAPKFPFARCAACKVAGLIDSAAAVIGSVKLGLEDGLKKRLEP